jgi:3-deoxy-D-manno-octulosonic-acid transferase
MNAARLAYSTLLRLATPAYLLRLWWRGRREPGYRQALPRRVGLGYGATEPGALWLHAVSLGETLAAKPLIAALRAAQPDLRLLLTHGTATGREAGQALLRPGDVQTWLPFDTPGATQRFVAAFRPSVGVLMETEIWPNVLAAAHQAGVPMVLANARLSARSARKGERFAALLRPAAQQLSLALAQSEADAQRLRHAGVGDVRVAGNLKFDLQPDPQQQVQGRAWRQRVGRPVLALANSRDGEEAMVLAAWHSLPLPRPLLLIVPRHPQRFDAVAHMVTDSGLRLARRSAWTHLPSADDALADVWLGDSLGEMSLYYSLSDLALLGGSFAALGGHNLIEASANGCPILLGPSTFNFALAAELALVAGAAKSASDMQHGVHLALDLLLDPLARERMKDQAREFAAEHRGTAARTAQLILALKR